METAPQKKRISKRDRKLQKRGIDLEVDLVVTSIGGEHLFSASLPHDTTVKALQDDVQEAVGNILVDRLVYGDQNLQATQTLSSAAIPTGATLHAVFGTVRGQVEHQERWEDVVVGWKSITVNAGAREGLEEVWRAKKQAADYVEVVTVNDDKEHQALLEREERMTLKEEWEIEAVNANDEVLPPLDLSHRAYPASLIHTYPIRYTFSKTTTQVGEVMECEGSKILELMCRSGARAGGFFERGQPSPSYDTVLARSPMARLKSVMKNSSRVVYFTYTEKTGGIGYLHSKTVKGMEVLVAGHHMSMSEEIQDYW